MGNYRDFRGYERENNYHSDLIHRNRAYHIYLENRRRYPLPYSAYEVHHKDFDKNNNKISNLQILTPTEHDRIHEEHEEQEQRRLQEEREIRPETAKKLDKQMKRFFPETIVSEEEERKENEENIRHNEERIRRWEEEENEKKKPKRRWWFIRRKEEEPEDRPFKCVDCGREIKHIGRCLPCNTRRKKERGE